MPVEFNHPLYRLEDDKIIRNADAPAKISIAENEEISNELFRYVEEKIVEDYGLVHIPVPDTDGAYEKTSILASSDWTTSTKLLLIVQNASGSQMGIFSRSLCFEQGISKGSMIPYIERALSVGYAIIILRPNTNSVIETDPTTGKILKKTPIVGSESPEIHAMYVLENVIPQAENLTHIALLGYGNGAALCKDILLRQLVLSKSDGRSEVNRIKAFVTIEASTIIEEDDPSDIRTLISDMAINMECNTAPKGYRLGYRKAKLGCTSISVGLPPGSTEVKNVASSINLAIDMVFEYLVMSQNVTKAAPAFVTSVAKANGHDATTAEITINPNKEDDIVSITTESTETTQTTQGRGSESKQPSIFSRFFGGGAGAGAGAGVGGPTTTPSAPSAPTTTPVSTDKKGIPPKAEKVPERPIEDSKLTVNDFDLLKVVGKGAFGKVMLVRKKAGTGAGKIYAMKVLKKSVIAALGQIEHTKSERDILFVIRHPFIVRLRFSFQSQDKLFLITDYYNGGSLYSHLRKSRQFTEERARFYGAELLLALNHLHQQQIVYRDLKLENILMDHEGHIALTDFGLSKQDIDKTGGATTFCGTAEYIAPELLNNQKYGTSVDWWSFGILIYEMMNGTTPFYDKNRKLMFYRIVNRDPNYPPHFTPAACECIAGLLQKKEENRLGSNSAHGAQDIKDTAFFNVINFDDLYNKKIRPPFRPEVVNEWDTAYVPESLLKTEPKDSIVEPPKRETNPKLFCPKKHEMTLFHGKPTTYSKNYSVRCDVCRQNRITTKTRYVYHCSLCRYDICDVCSARSLALSNMFTGDEDETEFTSKVSKLLCSKAQPVIVQDDGNDDDDANCSMSPESSDTEETFIQHCLSNHDRVIYRGTSNPYTGNKTIICAVCNDKGINKKNRNVSHCPFCEHDICDKCSLKAFQDAILGK